LITRDIYTPVTDGWSSLDCVMQESTEKIDFLKYMTKQVFPKEEDYFLKQRICNADDSTMALDYEISKECRILCGKFIYSR